MTASSPTPTTVSPRPRRTRTWPALLALYFLTPAVGEIISGSTPLPFFFLPFQFIFLPLLYGSSAILIHEVIVRRRLSWGNLLLLGAAFGTFQEGLVVQTWFTYNVVTSPSHDIGAYGTLWGTDWLWALELEMYHAFISIFVPLILLNVLFPRRAPLPWLGTKGIIFFGVWLVIPCGLLALSVATTQFAKFGYHGPPVGDYLAALGITIVLALLGSVLRFPAPQQVLNKLPPHLWVVRFFGFGMMFALFFVDIAIIPATYIPALVPGVLACALAAVSIVRVRTWAARPGWDGRHWLAVATGIECYFIFAFGPFVEFGLHLPGHEGMLVVNLLVAVFLALLARRVAHRTATSPSHLAYDAGP